MGMARKHNDTDFPKAGFYLMEVEMWVKSKITGRTKTRRGKWPPELWISIELKHEQQKKVMTLKQGLYLWRDEKNHQYIRAYAYHF